MFRTKISWIFILFIVIWTANLGQTAETAKSLAEYGDISTAQAAQETLQKAIQEALQAGGGVIVIPPDAPPTLKIENNSQTERKGYNEVPVVTIVDYRKGCVAYEVAPIGNMLGTTWAPFAVRRKLNLGQASLPHCGFHAAQAIDNDIISGAISYMATLTEPVQKGKDVRCYPDLIRGIWPGAYLNITGSVMGYAEPYDRVIVKSVGWDAQKRAYYFVCDLEHDHPAGALIYNKHSVNGLSVETYSNCDNQTVGDIAAVRHQYAVGDSFVISGMYKYNSDVFSGFGDEGGIVLNAETIGEIDGFHSTVEAIDWSRDEITYAPGRVNAHTLSNSRPLINMNRNKWITQGTVLIIPPGGKYKGEEFPSIIGGPGNVFNYQGGAIIGSPDCPWDESIVGRFFALIEDSEVILPNDPSPVGGYASAADRPIYRWYEIKEFQRRPDGTKRIKILRVRWSAVAAGAPTLFDDNNYTKEGAEKPLRYAIAPGAWIYDVSQGWADVAVTGGFVDKSAPRKIRVAPNGDRGTQFDFEVGDPIEQACGADPWHPRPLRIRQFDQIPSTMPSATIEMQQLGRVQVPIAIDISSFTRYREDVPKRKDKKPPYGTLLRLEAASSVGIDFAGDTLDTAIMFRQPKGQMQPIRWRNDVVGSSSLSVNPHTGDFQLQGGQAVNVGGMALTQARGLSATDIPAANLRGINVPVAAGAYEIVIQFPRPEADANYAVSLTPSWLTNVAVTNKTQEGFAVHFSTAAPAEARLDWIIVR